jgi:hypothetical protein
MEDVSPSPARVALLRTDNSCCHQAAWGLATRFPCRDPTCSEWSRIASSFAPRGSHRRSASASLPIPDLPVADLTFPAFVKVVSTLVESRIAPPSAHAASVETALRTFQRVCRQSSSDDVSASDLQLLLTRHGDKLDDKTFLQLLKAIKPTGPSSATGGSGSSAPSSTDSTQSVGGGKVVFLPGIRSYSYSSHSSLSYAQGQGGAAGMQGGKGRGGGREPQSTVAVGEVVDKLLLGGRARR